MDGGRRRWIWIAVAGVALVAATVGVTLAVSGGSPAPKPAPVAVVSTPTSLDEAAACAVLGPAAQQVAAAIKALTLQPDGSTIDRPSVASATAAYQRVADHGPADLASKVKPALDPLIDLNSVLVGQSSVAVHPLQIDLDAQGLIDQCQPYTG